MYHIKSDRRSQSSAAEIVLGLQECLKSTPLKAITVFDIHRVTGISRATFYRLFDTPEDVLIYQLDQMTEASADIYLNQSELSSSQLLEKTMELGLRNHDYLKALVVNGRYDLLFSYTERNFRKLDDHKRFFPEDMTKEERDYVIAHMSMAMVANLITWARNGQRETVQDIMRYQKRYLQVMGSLMEE